MVVAVSIIVFGVLVDNTGTAVVLGKTTTGVLIGDTVNTVTVGVIVASVGAPCRPWLALQAEVNNARRPAILISSI